MSDEQIIVFVIGRSGAGKSTATRYLCTLAEQQKRSAARINIYDFACALFQQDTEHKHFIPHPHDDGFDAIDTETFLSLCREEIERRVAASRVELVLVEYSCADYTVHLPLFSFFSRASILLLDAPLALCKKRIQERVAHPQSRDDHTTLSEPRFSAYFSQQNITGLALTIIDATQGKVQVQKELECFYHYLTQQERTIGHAIIFSTQPTRIYALPNESAQRTDTDTAGTR